MIDIKLNTIFILFLSVPISLLIWLLHNYVLKTVINVNLEDDHVFELTIIRSFLAVFLPFVLMIYGYRRKSVNESGAVTGLICAATLSLASFSYLIALAAFFFSSSRATKFRENEKKKIEKDFKSGGQRNWLQVICNGGMPFVLSALQIIEGLIGERPIDFQNSYISSMLGIGVMAAFACCNGDTWASELSPVISKADPVLITNFKRVPKGTNGGITIIGLIFSTVGGLFIGVFYWLSIVLLVDSSVLANASIPQFPVILLGALAGLFGSLVDSFLGATCQYSGLTDEGFITEHPGRGVKKISGNFKILNNHSVNLLSSVLTGVVIPVISIKFWSLFTYSY